MGKMRIGTECGKLLAVRTEEGHSTEKTGIGIRIILIPAHLSNPYNPLFQEKRCVADVSLTLAVTALRSNKVDTL
jgi:hypothetical protein